MMLRPYPRHRAWLKAVWMLLLCLLPANRVLADNNENTSLYLVTMAGMDQLHIEMPIYDEEGYDGWIDKGYVYVTPEGGSRETLLHYYTKEKSGSKPTAYLTRQVDGQMTLHRDQGYSDVNVMTTETSAEIPNVPGKEYFKLYLTWTVPDYLRGKKITISWSVHKKGNGPAGPAGESNTDISINPQSFTFTAVPDLIVPTLMEPVLGYDAAHAGQLMLIYTMATSNIKSMTAYYQEVNGREVVSRSMTVKPEQSGFIYLDATKCYRNFYLKAVYEDTNNKLRLSQSEPQTLPTLHMPSNLNASLQNDGKVKLTWQTSNIKWAEISPSDMWDIQRNTTGALNATAEWKTVGSVSFLDTDTLYTFVDETLMSSYTGQPVHYRLRRSTTAMWDWKTGTYTMTSLPFTLSLPGVVTATAKRGTWVEDMHTANLTFELGSSQYDSKGNFVLRSAADWEALADLLKGGKNVPNVIMANDIELPKGHSMLGSSTSRPYNGTFDGNGHTLTVNLDSLDEDYVAPFRYVNSKATTIRNLHVAGKINSKKWYIGGIVGYSGSSLTIMNCRVSATIRSDVNGDASTGGFVGMSKGDLEIRNCLFDGKFLGPAAYSFGGFVGWSDKSAVLVNSLFAPLTVDIAPSYEDCNTFVRSNNYFDQMGSLCYTTSLDASAYNYTEWLLMRTEADWDRFCQLVNEGKEVKVKMLNDITVSKVAATDKNKPFTGFFDGNGHTITVELDGNSLDDNGAFCAPIRFAKEMTVRFLNVRGVIKNGGMHTAGIIGQTVGGLNWVDNCHVSAIINLRNGATHAGGIMGHGRGSLNRIRNCLFDGSITAAAFYTNSFVGAIMGWTDGDISSSNQVNCCLENGFYTNFNHVGMNYYNASGGKAFGGSYCYNTHEWGECNKVGTLTAEELCDEMGSSNWNPFGNLAVPKQSNETEETGTYVYGMQPEALQKTLGSGWELSGNTVQPVMSTSAEAEHAATVWDSRAQVELTIEKSVNGKVRYTEQRILTDEELQKRQLTIQLLTPCVDHDFRFKVKQGTSPLTPMDTLGLAVKKTETGELARYEFNSNVKVDSLVANTQQSSVLLTWRTTGTGDFFRITRRDKATDELKVLEEAFTQTSYVDRTPQPQHVYIYTVEGVNQCEGEHVSTATAEGNCEPTGMVRGYLRLTDGTALAGYTVTAEPQGSTKGEKKTAVTDATGFYEIKGLKYTGSGTYRITGQTKDGGSFTTFYANFDENTNMVTNANLVMEQYFLLAGQVMYEGTSVPVIGAQFERDGEVVHNGSGKPIISDSQGRFSISMPQGAHTLRVVKDGHVFYEDGYFSDEDTNAKHEHDWQKNIYDYVFWDQTHITLQGRVVGGDMQGLKPLGQLASVNNLGDSLTIVMQLEGDNASYLVRDQLNASITERHQDYNFGTNSLDSCHMDTYRHRLVIKPNPKTGEYNVPMLPVKYKVTEIYAEGYPTLFQAGKVGETLDLSAYKNGDVATYSRIYHATPTLDVKQFNMTGESYMGINSYTDIDNTGKNMTIELWNKENGYTFGYPVFMAGSSVIMLLSAQERYYYNNNVKQREPDVVQLQGGEVRISNALIGTDNSSTVKLDSVGTGIYNFVPQNLTFTEENDQALKTLTMTLLYDSTYYDVLPMDGKPIRGYVMASKAKSQGRRVVADGGTMLVDILRDPPGASSSAYIESGTKLNYTFSQNVKAQAGVKLSFGTSKGTTNMWNGIWAGVGSGETLGTTSTVKTTDHFGITLASTYYNSWQYGYTFETTERISTSSSALNVGRDADVFIGMTQNAIFEDGIAVRAINDSTYKMLTTRAGGTFTVDGVDFKVPQGTMKLLATGKNSKGENVYLVRDEVLRYYTEVNSTFVHSQAYIEKELIPELINIRNTMILPKGTSLETAKQVAVQKGEPVYVSSVDVDDENFGAKNYYTQVNPDDSKYADQLDAMNSRIYTWIEFLAINEREKLDATDLVKRYDMDGRTSVTYTESFAISDAQTRYWQIPLIGSGLSGLSFGGHNFFSGGTLDGSAPATAYGDNGEDVNSKSMDINVFNTGFTMKLTPIASLDYNYNYGKSEGQSKKAGFTLSLSSKSNLLVDVYRSRLNDGDLKKKVEDLKAKGYKDEDINKIFFQLPTDKYIEYVTRGGNPGTDYGVAGSLNGVCSYVEGTPTQYRSFVYRTRGGATNQPYEDERKTKYVAPGVVLDEKTIEIDRLRIWADQASVSNVPYDEPARFTVHMANESELPAQCTEEFTYMLSDITNAKGAKITVDGNPVAGEGHSVFIPAGQVVTKQVEITAGAVFDYDNVTLQLFDPNDKKRVYSCALSAHFVPTAGRVNISLPGDKWVVNTESQYDSDKQQYYMPVRIDGFDVNYRNFDHIELQYKLSTQGDKEWVNVCSYYKDSVLMAKATGECKYIEDDGHIMAIFWGEADPIEQQYDLRAVNYCRYGSGFLTRSSNILTGVKDTRRPQLFGTPKPEDGILDIGDDIMLRFSEPIAGNYLRNLNNFQVLGQTNKRNILLSTSLHINADGSASSLISRNLAAKSFTVDVMLNPEDNGKEMIFFRHGEGNEQLHLGLTATRHLMASFIKHDTEGTYDLRYTSTEPVTFNGLHEVAVVFECNVEAKTTTVSFYDGTVNIGSFVYPGLYLGSGHYYLGNSDGDYNCYTGDMLEFRLWNRGLTVGELNDYRQRRLTGYELGLLDNFPLNEGTGDYSYNRVSSGADLAISQGSWKVPDGIGMKLDGQKGFRIKPDKFNRSDYHDYTIMFWFRTSDSDGTLLSNGAAENEAGAADHFNFGVKNGMLSLNIGGKDLSPSLTVNDGDWHHVALTVSRSRNVGNLYVDKKLLSTFAVDGLGGIFGNYLAAGATYTDDNTVVSPISGHIDEIAMYEMALSENIIMASSTMTPTGEELGLMAYLNFAQSEKQLNNLQQLVPTGVSLRRYRDTTTGEWTTQRDTLVAPDVVSRLADKQYYAPMRGIATLENIKYSYVAKDNEMYITLDVPEFDVEKTNVMVTVKDVADLNGNVMASPVAMDIYVYRNPLRWDVKQCNIESFYGLEWSFNAVVRNLSGKPRRFTIEGLPVWLTASQYSGTVEALGEVKITFDVSPYINIGDYDEVVYLVGEDGMTEPLPVKIKVRGEKPMWTVGDDLLHTNISMHIIGQVIIGNSVQHDKDDMLAAFDENHRLLGVTHLSTDPMGIDNSGLAYLTVYNDNYENINLYFEFFDASTGVIHRCAGVSENSIITFESDKVVGTTTTPAQFLTNNGVVQAIPLNRGWNWVSFNVTPSKVPIKKMFDSATEWEAGDGLEVEKSDGSFFLISYKAVVNPKNPKSMNYFWDYGDSIIGIDPTNMYRFYSNSNKQAFVYGFVTGESIDVHEGWNRIGYMSGINLPIGTAMAEYADKGADGDILKSQSEFAVLSIDSQGNRTWKGTLKYLRVGEGYMLKHNGADNIEFSYPDYLSGTRYGSREKAGAPLFVNSSGSSMTVVAMADGIDVMPGDKLTAYRDGEPCGISEADGNGLFYLNVADAEQQGADPAIMFTLERDGELLATTGRSQMIFRANDALGTPDQPTAISFVQNARFETGTWYDLGGRKLDRKPKASGVYIYNNEKVVIK